MFPTTAFFALIFSAFTSATILPGTSEAAFVLFAANHPEYAAAAWLGAGLANSAGSMVSYYMGRMLPAHKRPSENMLRRLEKYGVWLLLFAWIPIVGDALPLAAGWLRLNAGLCALMLLIGKTARYGLIYWGLSHF